jgi:UDP-N-acetylmuramoyl-tripeptide--D-alanyl-D-alanine ligase
MATPIPENRLPLTTAGVVSAAGGRLVSGAGQRAHVGITSDSRAVRPGSVFVALRGERYDGHAFLEGAVRAGATLLVVEAGKGAEGADVVEVSDTLVAWGAIARAHRERWGGRVLAVTGSAGKTTTKGLCAALLATVGEVHATRGNLNNRVGVPATLFALPDSAKYAVIEAGTSLRGEIAALAAIARPDVGIITNVGLAHAEGLGDDLGILAARAAVGREKGSLFEALPAGGSAIVNADDDEVERQASRTKARTLRFGRAEGADYRLLSRSADASLTFSCPSSPSPVRVTLPVMGEAFAIDFLAALAAVEATVGHPLAPSAVEAALRGFEPDAGRTKMITRADGALIIDDSYNANPLSMVQSIDLTAELAKSQGRRPVVVLGEMRELGVAAEAAHTELGDHLARAQVALAIGCGGLVDRTLARAEARGVAVVRGANVEEAILRAQENVTSKDVVLVKGSRGVHTERVVESLLKGGAS